MSVRDDVKRLGAHVLGWDHGRQGVSPFGALDDGGDALLMDALGQTSPTTEGNCPLRICLIEDYRDGWEESAGRQYQP